MFDCDLMDGSDGGGGRRGIDGKVWLLQVAISLARLLT